MSMSSGPAGSTRLAGVVVPTISPLLPDGSIDHDSAHRHTRHLIDAGVDGIFVLGTTGEFGFLTDPQRRELVRTVLTAVDGQVPVVVGVADTATARAVEQARLVADLPIAGLVATVPFYAATAAPEIRTHFRTLHRTFSDLPLYAYENPPRVNGVSLATGDLLDLAEDGVLAGVKDSSGTDARLRRHLLGRTDRGLEADFVVLTGSELTVDSAVMMGVDGVVPGLGNVDPAGYVRVHDLARRGELAEARIEQERLFRLFDIVAIATEAPMGSSSRALGAFKSAAQQLGSIAHRTMAVPAVALSDADSAAVAEIVDRYGPSPVAI